jgi:hypothetical protein
MVVSLYLTDSQAAAKLVGSECDFPKHHALSHLMNDIREKGAPKNNDTRLGEGEQSNVKADYKMTNKREDVNKQVRSNCFLFNLLTHLTRWPRGKNMTLQSQESKGFSMTMKLPGGSKGKASTLTPYLAVLKTWMPTLQIHPFLHVHPRLITRLARRLLVSFACMNSILPPHLLTQCSTTSLSSYAFSSHRGLQGLK